MKTLWHLKSWCFTILTVLLPFFPWENSLFGPSSITMAIATVIYCRSSDLRPLRFLVCLAGSLGLGISESSELAQHRTSPHDMPQKSEKQTRTISPTPPRPKLSEPQTGGQNCTQTFVFSNLSDTPTTSHPNPGISHQKVCFPWVSKDIVNFLAPTPSRGRPPPHPKISGPKSLGLGFFFFPDKQERTSPNSHPLP